jgi:ferritin
MINSKVEKAINEQINKEYFSAYLYLSMAAYCEKESLSGIANWMKIQFEEEQFHAMKFFNYINERGGTVTLTSLEDPKTEWKNVIEVFEDTLEHERFITKSINDIMEIAIEERDHATVSFLNWYIDEQVEEEANAETILNRLKLINGEGNGILMLDKEMSTRVFVPPTK